MAKVLNRAGRNNVRWMRDGSTMHWDTPQTLANDPHVAAERDRQATNRLYRTLRLDAKSKGVKFPPYPKWLASQG